MLSMVILAMISGAPTSDPSTLIPPGKRGCRVAWVPAQSLFIAVEWITDDETGETNIIAHAPGTELEMCPLPGLPETPLALRRCLSKNRWEKPQKLEVIRAVDGMLTIGKRKLRLVGRALVEGEGDKERKHGEVDDPDDFFLRLDEGYVSPDGGSLLIRYALVLEGQVMPGHQEHVFRIGKAP